jgi:SPP1 gp7 family putative phage head morphogenesis protein
MSNPAGQIPMNARVAEIAGIYARAQQALKAELSMTTPGSYSNLNASKAKHRAERIIGELNASAQRWVADPYVARGAALYFARVNFMILKSTRTYLAARAHDAQQLEADPENLSRVGLISSRILNGISGPGLGSHIETIACARIREARIEAMARGRRRTAIITGKESHALLRRFLDSQEPDVILSMSGIWMAQADLISEFILKRMLSTGKPDPYLIDSFNRMNRAAVRDGIMARVARGMTEASTDIEMRTKLMFKKEGTILPPPRKSKYFEYFTGTQAAIQKYVDKRGAALVTNLNADGLAVLRAMLDIALEHMLSPYQLSRIVKPCIGLTDRDAGAVSKLLASLLDQGMSYDEALAKAKEYADELRDARAMNIARTELAEAFNQGQLDALQDAMHELGAQAAKDWETAQDERTCEECAGLDGETVGINESFSNGAVCPPAHPSCRCSLGYTMLQ